MKASFAIVAAAATIFLSAAPFAAAVEVQGRSTVPAAGDPAPDPNDLIQRQNLSDRQAATRGMTSLGTTRLGNTTIHFGASRPGMFERNGAFLESPAARTVPSQR